MSCEWIWNTWLHYLTLPTLHHAGIVAFAYLAGYQHSKINHPPKEPTGGTGA